MKPLHRKIAAAPSVESILKQHAETISAPALIAAAEKHKKQMAEREAEIAFAALTEGTNEISAAVSRLREIRKKEKNAQEVLMKLNAAIEQFKKDGDVEAFAKARREASLHRIH